ncbi:hypothetical protein H9L39_07596 [Fusarium oxysporum f. sp. albedinis]|nr:hypothetical protein H9L39_07596 [Fusarium oxysporum f. sp. albedinis]
MVQRHGHASDDVLREQTRKQSDRFQNNKRPCLWWNLSRRIVSGLEMTLSCRLQVKEGQRSQKEGQTASLREKKT